MTSTKHWPCIALAIILVALIAPPIASAQPRLPIQPGQPFATRADLEAQATAAEAEARVTEARLIRHRLERGDFQDGDRILVTLRGAAGFSDTLSVRSGKLLELPQVAPLRLEGVLRSELSNRLTIHMAEYLRDPTVSARPLLRVGILGSVVKPGYYYTSADLPLSDVLMAAGGPSPDANVEKMSVRRGSQIILDERSTRAALTAGRSMDMLHMQAGDEIQVGKQRQMNWPIILSSLTAVLGLVIATQAR